MDIVNLLISLLSGAVGGNVAGAAAPDKSLGVLGNSVAGILGGGVGGYILQALDLWQKTGAGGVDVGSILANIGTSGVSGAVLMLLVSFAKQALNKQA